MRAEDIFTHPFAKSAKGWGTHGMVRDRWGTRRREKLFTSEGTEDTRKAKAYH
jgi:hypothetical protein